MPDANVNLAVILAALRRRRRLLAASLGLGIFLGVLLSIVRPPLYTADAEVLLQGSTDPDRAGTEARVATSTAVLAPAAASLPGTDTGGLATSVTAKAVTANVILISARADSPDQARQVAAAVTKQYVAYSSGLQRSTTTEMMAALTPRYESLNKQLADTDAQAAQLGADPVIFATGQPGASARSDQQVLEATRTRLVKDQESLQDQMTQVQTDAARQALNFEVVGKPTGASSPTADGRLKTIAEPALLIPLLCAAAIAVMRRRDERLYDADQVARVAGCTVLGRVSVGTEDPDELEMLRYRRAGARLAQADDAGGVPASVAFIHPAADAVAARAAEHLSRTVPDGIEVLRVGAEGRTLPDFGLATRVVLVLSVGTLSPVSLQTLAGACRDAGSEPYGVLLVEPDASLEAAPSMSERSAPTTGAVGI